MKILENFTPYIYLDYKKDATWYVTHGIKQRHLHRILVGPRTQSKG